MRLISTGRVTMLAAVLGLLLLVATAATAHLVRHHDGDDVKHVLDVRQAKVSKVAMGEYRGLDFTVRTRDRFTESDLNQGGVRVNIDSRGDEAMDFYLLANLYDGIYPDCSLYDENGYSEHTATIEVGKRYVSCSLPRYAVRPTKDIRWNVLTLHSGQTDKAPEEGWYEH